MLNRKLGLKLIDFGESYHPELVGTDCSYVDHEPGFTMPFSAPENYEGYKTYSYKNDVFSVGVIMHELFLGKPPFYFHSEKLEEKVYRERRFQDYFFFIPEGNSYQGDLIVFPLVESIIAKCLSPDP